MTKPKKTPQQLADEHWNFVEGILLEAMRMTMRVSKEMFIHGHKHGRRDRDSGVRTRPRKK